MSSERIVQFRCARKELETDSSCLGHSVLASQPDAPSCRGVGERVGSIHYSSCASVREKSIRTRLEQARDERSERDGCEVVP